MIDLQDDFTHIWRLCKTLKHIDDPYWITSNRLFQHRPGYREFLQKTIDERLAEWRKKNPTVLLNGVN